MTDFTELKVPGGGGHEFHNFPPFPCRGQKPSMVKMAQIVLYKKLKMFKC